MSPPLTRGAAGEAIKSIEVRKADYTRLQQEARARAAAGEEDEEEEEQEDEAEEQEAAPGQEEEEAAKEEETGSGEQHEQHAEKRQEEARPAGNEPAKPIKVGWQVPFLGSAAQGGGMPLSPSGRAAGQGVRLRLAQALGQRRSGLGGARCLNPQ